ncbi:hypothetical protein [Bryobacter aggregatus]|uniref:hypothetical protein n=1 Tax=Bryobacter aggregatus TaxID=360054 RepID=UPI0004E10F71|nr:hypothetical protein [Bryobacter aggregatus]
MFRSLLLLSLPLLAQPPADEILSKVAENFARGPELRREYVYTETILTRLHRSDGKLAREEQREYSVTPTGTRTEKKLTRHSGRYRKGNQYISYLEPDAKLPEHHRSDAAIAAILAGMFTSEENSRDGVIPGLFPFLPEALEHYSFSLLGRERFRDRDIYRVAFSARSGPNLSHPWAGEALIDVEDLHPLQIQTRLAPKFPFVVRTLFGTNLKQSGFSATYKRVAPGVWFPETYGTEFLVQVLFGAYKRVVTMALEAKDFRRVRADSSVSFEPVR